MKKRWMWMGAAAVILALGLGGIYYTRTRAQAPAAGRDPAVGLVIGIRMLERDPGTRLTDDQVSKILPFIKAMKDIPASDVEQVRAVVRTVSDLLTPEQRAAMDEARRRIQSGRRPGGPGAGGPGAGGPGAGGSGGGFGGGGFGGAPNPGFDPQQARARLFEATIRILEQRLR